MRELDIVIRFRSRCSLKLFLSIIRHERIGVGDLDPFGQGGGMIFDPFDMRRRQIGRAPGGLGVPGVLPPYVFYFYSTLVYVRDLFSNLRFNLNDVL